MKVIKPLKQGVLYKTFENNNRPYFVVTVFSFFPFTPAGHLLSEIDMWKFTARELGKEAILDLGMPKPRGEVVLTGSFFSPNGSPVPGGKVRIKLAGIEKTLYVFGNRSWKRGSGGLMKITEPEPIMIIDISYENAFGGSGFPLNPVGKGLELIPTQNGKDLLPLPNVENPEALITSPKDRPEPAGFAPLDMMWPQRASKAGTFDEKWLNERFPGLAEDLDWTYYNTAPADQQIEGFFTGDEPFEIEGMHPQKQSLTGTLPGIRSRCFINQEIKGRPVFKEIELHPDTVWLFPHAERGIVTCRGTIETLTDDADDITHLLVAYERLSDDKKPLDHYQHTLEKRLDKEKGYLFGLNEKDLIPPDEKSGFAEIMDDDETRLIVGEKLLAKNMKKRGEIEKEKIKARLKEAGINPEKLDQGQPAAPETDLDTMENLADFVEQSQAEAKEKAKKILAEQGLDYDRLVEKARKQPALRLRFSAEETIAQLRESGELNPTMEKQIHQAEKMLNEAYRNYGHYFPPALLSSAEDLARMKEDILAGYQKGESLAGGDFTGVDLSNLDLSGIDLHGAFLERANLAGANLENADLSDCVLVRADLSGANLASTKMTSTGLGEAKLDGADLREADLAKAVLVKASLPNANLRNANLEEADFSEAVLTDATMTGAVMKKCRFMESDLTDATLAGADLSESFFLNASLKNCDLSRANLSSVTLIGVTADRASFKEAQLNNSRILNESSFQETDFSHAEMTQANLRGSNLSGSRFEMADICGSDFSECQLHKTSFYQSNAKETQFVKANLTDSRMVAINLFGGSLQKANLDNTDLRGANLCMVDLMKVKFKNTNIGEANLAKTFINRWISK
ncbi:MAG: DUF2169 domain-containing protein [Deltaproteobacteria bacterium]|nr:DUF2169 domain-containing protein [Deltaproteobacteria bacterium]